MILNRQLAGLLNIFETPNFLLLCLGMGQAGSAVMAFLDSSLKVVNQFYSAVFPNKKYINVGHMRKET